MIGKYKQITSCFFQATESTNWCDAISLLPYLIQVLRIIFLPTIFHFILTVTDRMNSKSKPTDVFAPTGTNNIR